MLVPQLYLNGKCVKAIEVYKKAFNTKVDNIMFDTEKEPEKFVIHAEMHIHAQRVMLSDWGGNISNTTDTAMQLVVIFNTEEELKQAYEIIKPNSKTIIPLAPTFYSPLMADFLDEFGVRWCFMVK